MSITLTMPRLSDTMEQGTIIRWNIKEGQEVLSGEIVADIETDKATMEMQAYDDGVVAKILVGEGTQVPVGTPIAMIAEQYLTQVVEQNQSFADVYNMLGVIYHDQGQYQKALRAFEAALRTILSHSLAAHRQSTSPLLVSTQKNPAPTPQLNSRRAVVGEPKALGLNVASL